MPDEAIFSQEYFVYCKRKWRTAGGKDPLFGPASLSRLFTALLQGLLQNSFLQQPHWEDKENHQPGW